MLPTMRWCWELPRSVAASAGPWSGIAGDELLAGTGSSSKYGREGSLAHQTHFLGGGRQLGIFNVSILHNVVHLVFGVAGPLSRRRRPQCFSGKCWRHSAMAATQRGTNRS